MPRLLAVSFVAVALAGCVGPPQAPEAPPAPVIKPTPRPTPPRPAPLPSDWNDWPFTPGSWFYEGGADRSRASFGTDQRVVVLSCDRASRRIELTLIVGADVSLVVRTTTMIRELQTRSLTKPTADKTAMPTAQLSANDPLLDAIAFSRGRFVIEQAGQPPLVLPPQAEIGRVIEDCRG
ncbi:MAG: hypothetical protein JSR79_12925 [Proteobacteria bacterium]|nr:hypothetical protein [Pseudomonadota bacterium]